MHRTCSVRHERHQHLGWREWTGGWPVADSLWLHRRFQRTSNCRTTGPRFDGVHLAPILAATYAHLRMRVDGSAPLQLVSFEGSFDKSMKSHTVAHEDAMMF